MEDFLGFHSEWNLSSPGGWDYQRTTQEIGATVWKRLNEMSPTGVDLDIDNPLFRPVEALAELLVERHRARNGSNPGRIAVVAEEETLETVTENINLAERLDSIPGITGVLAAPQEVESANGRVCCRGGPVSVIFMDFNTDVLLALHRKHGLKPLLQAVRENLVVNPRGTEPINVKSMFEVLSSSGNARFHEEVVRRTPWTRRFFERATDGPKGEEISDLVEWTRRNWSDLVLKPERGYSGKGVFVGGINADADIAVERALGEGGYIVQKKVPLDLWSEEVPELDEGAGQVALVRRQTDFRCLIGPNGLLGFLARLGGVPTNVGSGGGMQPLGVVKSGMSVREAADRINRAVLAMSYADVAEAVDMQRRMAEEQRFTYLLGPIKICLRPRLISAQHLEAFKRYSAAVWSDCIELEKMWIEGVLDDIVAIEEEELAIARTQPWGGSTAIVASDGLFSFGAHLGKP